MINSATVINLSKKNTPKIDKVLKKNINRFDIFYELKKNNNIGIELGVANGSFSKKMVNSGKFSKYFGVDSYEGIHDINEYKKALKNTNFTNFSANLLKMDFSEALSLFDDDYFDFIYVDGFAHTGEEGGKTIIDWFQKLKVGGILAGDDYHDDWPLVVWAVNDLCKQLNCNLNLTQISKDNEYSSYPSWYVIKNNNNNDLKVNELLYKTALKEKKRIGDKRINFYSLLRKTTGQFLEKFGIKNKVKNIFNI